MWATIWKFFIKIVIFCIKFGGLAYAAPPSHQTHPHQAPHHPPSSQHPHSTQQSHTTIAIGEPTTKETPLVREPKPTITIENRLNCDHAENYLLVKNVVGLFGCKEEFSCQKFTSFWVNLRNTKCRDECLMVKVQMHDGQIGQGCMFPNQTLGLKQQTGAICHRIRK